MERVFTVTIQVTADVEKGVSLDNIVNDLEYDVSFNGEEATINGTELIDWNLIK